MLDRIILLIILFLVWVAFSGFIEPFFLVAGGVSCVIAYLVARRMGADEGIPARIIPHLPFYLIWLYVEVIKSSIDVAIRVWRANPDISPVIKWVKASQKNAIGKATYANSITITPGTVCIDVKGNKLEVHALTQSAIKELESGRMDNRVVKVTG